MSPLRDIALAIAAALAVVPAGAQSVAPAVAAAAPVRILFVGNSFTYGANSPVKRYRAETVTDLNGGGVGGVPALFKAFTEQAGLRYAVSLETASGMGLDYHYRVKRAVIDRAWDVVILQGHSLLDVAAPGDPASHIANAAALAAMFTRANPRVDVELMATWSRADQVYRVKGGRWYGTPIAAMAGDLRAASHLARRSSRDIHGVLPVGEAWNRAIAAGIADPDPYDGISFGQIDLWSFDQYHASAYGYYLEALVVFGRVTKRDPRTLGANERAAEDLGIAPGVAAALQRVAYEQLAAG